MHIRTIGICVILFFIDIASGCSSREGIVDDNRLCLSGIYPHLAYYNHEAECGTGAVVPWAGSLWTITYAPHSPYGSSDKLYQITPQLEQIVRSESIGGTPADRLIHKESNQLFIGPYAIDAQGNVRTMSYRTAPGRYTGAARHLTDPESKIYIATMEEGFYEVDVNTLETKMMWSDDNVYRKPKDFPELEQNLIRLPGWHGKGLYSGQGVLLYSNNGEHGQKALERFDIESGSLNEWDGKTWKTVRRNQFTEITGPGGICGNPKPETDPIWAVGFDHKSLLLGAREPEGWSFFRLPKASYTYDGAHGWNTEWPRIRNVGTDRNPDYLMTMHGLFWRFPGDFTASNTAGIRPRSAYLKVIGDFTRWGDRLVMGCDDSAQKEFLNTRKAKGGVEGPGQSNSNLWFMSPDGPDSFGPDNAGGYVWLRENIEAGAISDAFLFAGWEYRCSWLKNAGDSEVTFTFEIDRKGDNKWTRLADITLPADASGYMAFEPAEKGEWIRVSVDKATRASVGFVYGSKEIRGDGPEALFNGVATLDDAPANGGLLYGLGQNRRALGLLGNSPDGETGYYEIDAAMNIVARDDEETAAFIREKYAISFRDVEVQNGSVLVVDDAGRRWRLPLGDSRYDDLTKAHKLRVCREVATERDLFNCHGTFYELPAENADGYAKIRPIASHNLVVNDYASYRGLLVMTGLKASADISNPHIFKSEDGKAAVWAGAIDDLWKLGKPTGKGGPWVNASVERGVASDPYLIWCYDRKTLRLSHDAETEVRIGIEVDPTGDSEWVTYKSVTVAPGQTCVEEFPASFMARWIRFVSDTDCTATAWLEYK